MVVDESDDRFNTHNLGILQAKSSQENKLHKQTSMLPAQTRNDPFETRKHVKREVTTSRERLCVRIDSAVLIITGYAWVGMHVCLGYLVGMYAWYTARTPSHMWSVSAYIWQGYLLCHRALPLSTRWRELWIWWCLFVQTPVHINPGIPSYSTHIYTRDA